MPIRPPSFKARQYLGAKPNDEAIQSFIKTITPPGMDTPQPEIKRFPDCTYYSYKSLGLSLCFVPTIKGDDSALKLDSIDIYNGYTKDGFKPFVSKDLPFGLSSDTQAHEIVSQLGEPDRKGGGGKTHLPCWIEYQFEDGNGKQGGIQFQLHGIDWDDREMGWTSLALF